MTYKTPLKIAVLGSGKGSNFIALHQSIQNEALPIEVVLVASDFQDAGIISYARSQDFPVYTCPPSRFKTFMRVIKEPLLSAFTGRIINIHPSLLPEFKGLKAWEQAFNADVTETGCTVHWVDASLDGGDIISQKAVPVLPDDSVDSLYRRIQVQEHILLPEVISQLAADRPFDT